jgi:hypothetical protein
MTDAAAQRQPELAGQTAVLIGAAYDIDGGQQLVSP